MSSRTPKIPFGTLVTVRVMISMPGKHEGQVFDCSWEPEIAMLVRQSRYELVPPYPGSEPEPEPEPTPEPPPDPDPEQPVEGQSGAPSRTSRKKSAS